MNFHTEVGFPNTGLLSASCPIKPVAQFSTKSSLCRWEIDLFSSPKSSQVFPPPTTCRVMGDFSQMKIKMQLYDASARLDNFPLRFLKTKSFPPQARRIQRNKERFIVKQTTLFVKIRYIMSIASVKCYENLITRIVPYI